MIVYGCDRVQIGRQAFKQGEEDSIWRLERRMDPSVKGTLVLDAGTRRIDWPRTNSFESIGAKEYCNRTSKARGNDEDLNAGFLDG